MKSKYFQRSYLLFASSILLLSYSQSPGHADFTAGSVIVVPQPEQVTSSRGGFQIQSGTKIVISKHHDLETTANLLAAHLRMATGYPLPVVTDRNPNRYQNAIVLTTENADQSLGSEGYTLDVESNGVTINAVDNAGIFYGTQTLRQLLPQEIEDDAQAPGVSWTVPAVVIRDTPRFAERGIMLDAGRQMESIDFIKRTIDRMGYLKLNTLHWHLTDDEGWRVEIKRYPKLTPTPGAYYTQAQLRDIVAYAEARNVTIIPEIEIGGHDHSIVTAYPELGTEPSPVNPNGSWSDDTLCPAKESLFTFIDNVLTEVMAIFPSKTIHIGGDEVDINEWQTSPECVALMQKNGLKDLPALKDYLTNRVSSFVQSRGRRIEKWTDKTDGSNVPANEVAEEWNISETAVADIDRGNDVVVADVRNLYFDYGWDTPSLERVLDADPYTLLPNLTDKEKQHVLGIECCLWSSFLPNDAILDKYLWPRIIAVADDGWVQAGSVNYPDFKNCMIGSFYPRIALMGTSAANTPANTLHNLIVRSGFDWGKQVGSWVSSSLTPGDMYVDQDITNGIHAPGVYVMRFQYTNGPSGYYVEEVDIMKNGVVATKDVHQGWAGAIPGMTTYELSLPDYDSTAHYTAHIHYKTNNGDTDTNGAVWLFGPE